MAKVDPKDFLLNTDYEMDKIIYFNDGNLSAGQSKNITHKLGFKPLVFGVCAFNEDFSDPRALPFQQITQSNTVNFNITSTSTQISMNYINYASPDSKAYYRIYAFEPSDSRAKVGATSKHAKTFILNTDYNYCKLFKKGIATGDTTISHNLGYIPQILAWREDSGVIAPIENSLPSDPMSNMPFYVKATSNNIIIKNIPKVHYRIYYDEA